MAPAKTLQKQGLLGLAEGEEGFQFLPRLKLEVSLHPSLLSPVRILTFCPFIPPCEMAELLSQTACWHSQPGGWIAVPAGLTV